MRRQYIALMTLLAVGVSTPAWAQIVIQATPAVTSATPDTVVARLMSFDRNADGKIVVGELPERMQDLVVRGDTGNDGALDSIEVRRLAMMPATVPGRNGSQPGHWGVGGLNFDTSKQIEDALDDLRLAADIKERALDVVRTFQADAPARVQANLLATMRELLTAEQLEDFRAGPTTRTVSVPAIRRDGVTIFGATPEEAAGQERVMVTLREFVDLEHHIEKYGLDADSKQLALAAIRQSKTRMPGLSETERAALTEQLRGLLTDEQRDDLHAALGRRPLVQSPNVDASMLTIRAVQGVLQTAEPSGGVRVKKLVLTQ